MPFTFKRLIVPIPSAFRGVSRTFPEGAILNIMIQFHLKLGNSLQPRFCTICQFYHQHLSFLPLISKNIHQILALQFCNFLISIQSSSEFDEELLKRCFRIVDVSGFRAVRKMCPTNPFYLHTVLSRLRKQSTQM